MKNEMFEVKPRGVRRPFVAKWWRCREGYRTFDSDDEFASVMDIGPRSVTTTDIEGNVSFSSDEPFEHDVHDTFCWIVMDVPPSEHFPDLDFDWYNPLEMPSLHRELASLSFNIKPILQFVNRFGFLGRALSEVQLSEPEGHSVWAEGAAFWCGQIARMQVLLKLWDLYSENTPKSNELLGQLISVTEDSAEFLDFYYVGKLLGWSLPPGPPFDWDDGDLRGYDFDPEIYWEVDMESVPNTDDRIGRLRSAARLLLREAINECLCEGAEPAIDVRPGTYISLIPIDLLGAIYIQFALEVTGQSPTPIRCPVCGRWFHAKHGAREYCNNKCKMKAYRKNKKQKEQSNG